MKKNILLLIILISINLKAQTITVNYTEKSIISPEKLERIPEFARNEALKSKDFVLTYSNGISLYKVKKIESYDFEEKNQFENRIDSLDVFEIKTEIKRIASNNTDIYYYKDFLTKEMLFEFYNGGKLFYGKDSLQNWNWQILEETKIIDGFNCKRAKSNWLGFEFNAWFTNDIGVAIGPEKFDGLPGLILYVSTPFYEWKATKIKNDENITKIVKPDFSNKKTSTLNEINDYINNIFKNNTSTINTIQEGNKTITTETIIIK